MSNMAKADDRVVVMVQASAPPSGGSRTTGRHTAPSSPRATAFNKGSPAALGVVQIMIAVFMVLVECVQPFEFGPRLDLGVIIGIYYWASIIFVTAGSLTVAAEKYFNKCLVNAALGMNVVATVTAGISIILFSIITSINHSDAHYHFGPGHIPSILPGAISGIMAVLSVLEFIVSICVSAFACKATCYMSPEERVMVGYEMSNNVNMTQRGPQDDYEPLRW